MNAEVAEMAASRGSVSPLLPPRQALCVAAVQAASVAGDVEGNVATAAAWVEKAAAQGARLVVLPELFISGYDPQTLISNADQVDVTVADRRLSPLAEVVGDTGVTALVGAAVRSGNGERSLSLLSFDPQPTVAYSKQHLWEAEQAIFTPGQAGATVELDQWPLGMGICYDGCFPEHARAATDDGALAYVCPSAYLVGSEHRRDLYYAARAIDNGIYCVMAGLVGECGSSEFSGGTAIYDPQGRVLARVDSGEGLAIANLEWAAIEQARRINPYERDRPASLGGRTRLVLGS